MCGIVAVLYKRPGGAAPELERILPALDETLRRLRAGAKQLDSGELASIAAELETLDSQLRGPLGVAALLAAPALDHVGGVEAKARALTAELQQLETALDSGELSWADEELEAGNAVMVRLQDVVWALGHDRTSTARGVADLAEHLPACLPPAMGGAPQDAPAGAASAAYWAIQVALSSLDRLEVRGRDSAGLHVLVTGHGLDLDQPENAALCSARSDELFTSMAMRAPAGALSFVYKVAAEIGELGDNTRALRNAIREDRFLARALGAPEAIVTVLGHTRWASVGAISEANAHPLNSEQLAGAEQPGAGGDPYVIAAINGDIDNHRELRELEQLRIAAEITTDSKVLPALVARSLAEGQRVAEGQRIPDGERVDGAFCASVARCEGSAAIALSAAATPDRLHLALRGSGQSLYVGLAGDAFVIASEPYGVVQETASYLPMEGEGGADGSAGQVVVLERAGAGTLAGVRRLGYDGASRPVEPSEVRVAEITARDIDRSGFPHFLLKEISEAPRSFMKTLRGKIVEGEDGHLVVKLGSETLPPAIVERLERGEFTKIRVIAQGTAAVAAQSVAASIAAGLSSLPIAVDAVLATELSGFELADDMSDTLVIAVSQSGTTTDTNRTVDLVRSRGARVVSIVNRRGSDLVDKSDGVLYTSDGRDVEMSVASTKAFYAQVAAGLLLAQALAEHLGCRDARRSDRLLRALSALPDAMAEVLEQRHAIAAAAGELAPYRRHWSVVGSGPNRVAAEEIRIKLSELCYHSIACDGTEDKKHIDLSSEPLVLVCAAGLSGATADDAAKEVAIFAAHKAAPVVVADHGEQERFAVAAHVIAVPAVEPELAFVLSVMVGHLFGYEAALAIDAHARPLRVALSAIEGLADGSWASTDAMLRALAPSLELSAAQFFSGLRDGAYNGNLEAATAVRIASLLRYATGVLPVEGYELEYQRVGTPEAIVEDLAEALTTAIGELTRPVDAIKHQAKTVTVGISRSEDELLGVPLVASALAAGASVERLSYRGLRTLARLAPAVVEVEGFTRYRIEGDVTAAATIEILERGGIAAGLSSRTESDNRLLGAKHRAAQEREVTVAVGARDGRSLILVPETEAGAVCGMTLLHVQFRESLSAAETRGVLEGYRDRYAALVDAVTETETAFSDERLEQIPLLDLLTLPVRVLAEQWSRLGSQLVGD
ncbi:MAG TPA: SIS domain-containing protein [Solirubrobacteraceae bacterium]|nr:SIS domain-containing protein [Solirubrobacteraceae bacterium]